MKKILLTTLTVFALSAQADLTAVDRGHNWSNSPIVFEVEVRSAKAEQRRAKKAGFEWHDIGKFLKKAAKMHKAGDTKGAMKLVKKAKTQAMLGQQQAKDQANAGPSF
ncbi:hypothetical protein CRYPD_873 [uncultured Candidatus Thioglobus sp.]|nr:hypothetical protein CRYPD_873 [uncultured Candidatus Thioglobus sp.]